MRLSLLVWAVVAVHLLITHIPALGALAILKWRWLVWVHVPILVWAFSIPFVHWPCPLTDLEKALRAKAQMPVYATHFNAHYIFEPLGAWTPLWTWGNALVVFGAYVVYFTRRSPA